MKMISVIIPVYNVEAYLGRCLDSILSNSYPDLEIICVNDGSTDNSAAILSYYAEKDARFRIIQQENKGVSAARNAGLEAAAGELISFVDADDWIHPQFFQIMSHFQLLHDADIVICERHCVCPGECVKPKRISDSLDFKLLNGKSMMSDHTAKAFVWGRVFRKSLLKGMRFPVGVTLGEDRAFNLALACSHPDMRIVRLSQSVYYYFSREGSAVNTATQDDWLALASRILHGCGMVREQQSKQLFLTEAFKLVFSARCACQVNSDESQKVQIDELIAGCMAELKKTPNMPIVRKTAYRVIVYFPGVYKVLLMLKNKRQTR